MNLENIKGKDWVYLETSEGKFLIKEFPTLIRSNAAILIDITGNERIVSEVTSSRTMYQFMDKDELVWYLTEVKDKTAFRSKICPIYDLKKDKEVKYYTIIEVLFSVNYFNTIIIESRDINNLLG